MSSTSESSSLEALCPGILPNDKNTRRLVLIALLFVVLLGISLRVYKLNASLWTDEMHTFDRGGGSVLFSLNVTGFPLINVLAHFARQFGDSAWILRLPSVVSGVVAIGLGFILGGRVADWRAGLLAALLVAISVSFVEYSQEARYYSHVVLFVLLVAVLVDCSRCSNNAIPYLSAGVAVFLGCLTHLFFVPVAVVFVAVSAGLGGVFFIWSYSRRYVIRSVVLALALASGFSAFLVTENMRDEGENLREQVLVGALGGVFGSEAPMETEKEYVEENGYRLYLDEYVGYIKELSGIHKLNLFWGFVAISLFGCMAIVHKTPLVGLACLGVLILFPLALSQITASHWYTARYFVGNYALHVISFAVGVSWLGNALLGWGGACLNKMWGDLYRRVPASAVSYGKALCVVAVGAIPYYGAFGALQGYYEARPLHDWRGAAEFIAQDLYPEDVLLFAEHRGSFLLLERGVDHYLREIPGAPWPELTVQERIETEEDLVSSMSRHTDSAKQLVIFKTTLEEYGQEFEEILKREFSVYEAFGEVVVFADTSPQHKVASYEYIESELDGWRSDGKVELTPSKSKVSFQGTEDEQSIVRVRFPQRFEIPVANSEFERWAGGLPSSWSFEGEEGQIVDGEKREENGAIIRSDGGRAVLFTDIYFDVLHEGVSLEIKVRASVTGDVDAALFVRPTTGCEESYIRKDIEEGREEFVIEWPITEALRHSGVRLGVEVGESEEGYVRVDDVKVYVNNPERRLTFFDQWTIAMDVKLEDVLPGEHPSRVFRSNISGRDEDEENYWIEVHRAYGSRDWHRQSFLLEEGHTIPAGAHNVTFRCGIWQGQGKAHIRDFRIVSGARPYRSSP